MEDIIFYLRHETKGSESVRCRTPGRVPFSYSTSFYNPSDKDDLENLVDYLARDFSGYVPSNGYGIGTYESWIMPRKRLERHKIYLRSGSKSATIEWETKVE
ncbi:MAG: hypothetical protein HYT70_04495 [Candidatus Aenigmarchaeota archaeon]|nr:hypothetical protein [Candidatus Aenigmarchaeota archaeon]